jgi:hypothetical protein
MVIDIPDAVSAMALVARLIFVSGYRTGVFPATIVLGAPPLTVDIRFARSANFEPIGTVTPLPVMADIIALLAFCKPVIALDILMLPPPIMLPVPILYH